MLTSVVVLLALLVVGNLLLTWGMVRRLRALQEHVSAMTDPMPENGLEAGDEAPDFSASTPSGDLVTRDDVVRGRTVLAFLSPHCDACEEHLPAVRRLGRSAGPEAVVAVVDGTPEESGHLVEGLQGDVPVLFAARSINDLMSRYRVNVFPSYYVVDADHLVSSTHLDVDELLPSGV
ncbi:MAG: peroxiredoxin family protein [Phycicoccus sp.]